MDVAGEAYQKVHGEWIRNRNGSELYEVFTVALVAPLAVFALKLTRSSKIFAHLMSDVGDLSLGHWVLKFLWEFAIVIVPQLAVVTCPYITDHLDITGVCLCIVVLFIFAKSSLKFAHLSPGDKKKNGIESVVHGSTPSSVTCFRAGTLLMTVICILAVDFPAFPARFAKTETYGVSLMDAGVGMFVVANAVVAPEVRRSNSSLTKSLWSSGPLLALGFGRLAILKAIGYHDNPAEYGTHWNFFFTLALIKTFATLIFKLGSRGSRSRGLWALLPAVLMMSSYQLLLSRFGLSSYILGMDGFASESVTLGNILHHNRSGIASCAGFLSLYLAGVTIGCIIFADVKRSLRQSLSLVFMLFGISLLMLALLITSWMFVEPPSRRLANLSYILYVIMLASCLLALVLTFDLCAACLFCNSKAAGNFRKITSPPFILYSVNRHGLAVFLFANVLTGMVNLSIATIYAPTLTCVSILIAYTMCVTFAPYLWQRTQTVRKSS